MRFYRNVFRLSHACHAFLSECLACGSYLSCGSIEMSCVRFAPIRSSRNVSRSAHICHAFLSKGPVFDHACCLPPVRQTGRLAICCVSIPPWVVIAIRAFSDVAWLSDLVGSFRACAFSGGDPDGDRKGRGNAENEGTRRTESAARRKSAFA